MKISDLSARQIFDSRGMPTVEAQVILEDGSVGRGSAPSGASTGSHEALELRDGGDAYAGKGISRAVEAVNGPIREEIRGMDARQQACVDERLRTLDGTANKERLGANALIAVSWAVADAAARSTGLELYQWLGGLQSGQLPCPMFNVINGGKHADNNLEIQEFMLVPTGAESFHEAMRMGAECYQALQRLLREQGVSTAVGDEGGFAPSLSRDEEALEWMVRAIEAAGWKPGEDVSLALDVAATEWAQADAYRQSKGGAQFRRGELIEYYDALSRRYPLISIEDPLGEEDFEGFAELTDALGTDLMIVGDDLFTTNADRLLRGVASGAANAILIKPNQIGTLTETMETIQLARQNAYSVVVSHRSGETLSTAIADLAVAVGAQFIKAGAPARGERLAKYNRLMEIETQICG